MADPNVTCQCQLYGHDWHHLWNHDIVVTEDIEPIYALVCCCADDDSSIVRGQLTVRRRERPVDPRASYRVRHEDESSRR
ncbi:hypothetical protein [Natronobacterium gregoryi]|uniref:Uncharacterized protein n=2 Tax=Natronobacterium gregoryi TaxID=44930 RepID=L0ACW1_NATGS|nr:hypothetical protein [Natronobacterium gregoryi]AFZ71676.1 hypothetical protein Natgr_0421 [Natronobacterium gregoryi SP2]ELY72752.1 hypothetical protein C490_02918 [Natronobacterium gregoryi SP2]PLK20276.1 hypothetical protein CYV19_10620 [Natronobacterium gregoryi SP2]SFJ24821.1 hypothetical protein SAMN05443661_11916 [Natronobacterium gregoryi]